MSKLKLLTEIRDEITTLLSNLIQIDTTNPPGNETRAARYLARTLREDNIESEILESAPGRGNLIARLKGTERKPSLLLLSHLDVVTANPREWKVHPFSGQIENGFVWGRGALDMKSLTAIEVMVLKLVKRNNIRLKSDLLLAATADEEKGGELGAGWLTRDHAEKIRADYVINEGGGTAIPLEGKNLFTIQTAEKGILWLRIQAKGTPGHGSKPGTADNAIIHMNKVIEKLGTYRPRAKLIPTVRQYIKALAREYTAARKPLSILLRNPTKADQALDQLAEKDRFMAEEIRAMIRMTSTPTIIRGGVKENIIPSECETVFDCRLLPGQSTGDALTLIKTLLKEVDLNSLDFETIQANEPSESQTKTPLYELIGRTLKECEPDCSIAPLMLTGGTDSRFFRRMGITCYGFQPIRPDLPYAETQKTIHGVDERISIDNLIFGTTVLYEVVQKFMI
jgi:acetylornithine deacetylase/succinyl-diaminopimelate desuccinylase-like protein